jgi:hypothetical protein
MPISTCPAVDPFGIFPRFVRFLTGLAALAGFFSGATAAPRTEELTQAQIEERLADAAGPLREFVRTLESSMRSGAIADAEALVDRDAILTRATQRVFFDGDKIVRDLFCDSTRRAWDERGVTRDYAGTKFRFLRARILNGRAGLLFRSSGKDGQMNYALFTLHEPVSGEFRIADIFVVGLNEFLSDTLHRTWINIATGFLGDEANQIKGVNPDYVAHIGEIAEMSRQMNAGKYEEVLKSVKALPASVQRERTVLLLRMEAAERVSIEERNAVFAAWLAAYPDEMELPLKFVDFYSSQHRWNDAERVLRGLMARLGDDAMLKMELGRIMFRRQHEQGLISAAELSARKAP